MIDQQTLIKKLHRSFTLYEELVQSLQETQLNLDCGGLPSNTIGQQLWCVVGARESYLRAIKAGSWQGFACSLNSKSIQIKTEVFNQLAFSRSEFLKTIEASKQLSEDQQSLLIDLLEHEAQHQGQMIRYLYAQKLQIPDSWKKRYSLK